MTLGEKIRELRKAYGMSQELLAEKMEVSRQAISKWEAGTSRPSTDNLIRLARIFDVQTEHLVRPDMRVELVESIGKEIKQMSKGKKVFFVVWSIIALMLFAGSFALALYGRISGAMAEETVLGLVVLAAGLILSVFLPVIVSIMHFVYRDCRERNIKPAFWVVISGTFLGLGYYLIRRDSLNR